MEFSVTTGGVSNRDGIPRRSLSVKPGGDAADDDGAGAAKRRAVRPGNVSVSGQFQDAELLGQETAIALFDSILGPFIEIGVPHRSVIRGNCGNAAKRVVRPMPIGERGRQALTLRIVAAAVKGAVGGDENPFNGTSSDVIDSNLESAHARSERVRLDGRDGRIARLGGDVQDRI